MKATPLRISIIGLALFVVLGFLCKPAHAANLWQSATFGVGAQGAWYNNADNGDLEAAGKAAISITPHISLVGQLAYGFSNTYLRESLGARITATDVDDNTFSVGLGLSRHFRSEPGGLQEWAGEAAIGWKPLQNSSLLVTALAAYGLDSRTPFVTAGVVFPVKITGGGQ
jgi:hypothetical protein